MRDLIIFIYTGSPAEGSPAKSGGGGLLIYRIDCSFNFFEIASAHFVGKFTYINIVDFFITRSITSNKFTSNSLNQEIHILTIFNLVQLSYILSIALLYVLSVRQKVQGITTIRKI